MAEQKESLLKSLSPTTATAEPKATLAKIDASCRWPVMVFFGTALFWLLVGTVFALVASLKLHWPEFLDGFSWLTFGRVRPAHLNSVTYGWAAPAGIAVGIWLMARLCQVKLRHPNLLLAAGVFWNIGVLLGTISILAGEGTSIEWLEYPNYVTFILFIAYAFIAVWAVIMFRFRQLGHVYVSQWYLFGAFFWFPWLYGVANIMLNLEPVEGSIQAIINWWFGHNVLGLWFTPIGLATIYYMIPKVIGKPVYSYQLSIVGFWTLALFYSWNGAHHLIGGPVPAWIQSASIVASVMMVIPVTATAINFHMTMAKDFGALKYSPTLRFVYLGAVLYTLVSLQGSSMAIRTLNELTHFTHYTIGHAHLGLYAFFTMVMFGAMYYIVPRMVGREWPSALWMKVHFWTVTMGVLFMFGALSVGGVIQGWELSRPEVPFITLMVNTKPWLVMRSASGVMIAVGHCVFGVLFAVMCWPLVEPVTKFFRRETE